MKKTRNEKGITLVALIITVIILLIIAAVTIGAIQNGGIIDYAKKARDNYIENADSENTTLGSYLELIENNIPGKEEVKATKISEIAIGEKLEKTTKIEDEEGKIFWVPEGYAIVEDENEETLVNKGLVITDEVDSTGKSTGNEWVWVPASVSEISEVVNGKNVGKLYDFSETGATPENYPTTQNSEFREPDVVTGASSGADSASGKNYDAAEANLSIVLEGEYAKTKTAASFKAQLQEEFDNMIESVSKYGGYYIGRYEAGGTISSPVLKQGATVIRNTDSSSNWYYMYKSAKALAANEKVTSGMIWGCQWDNTLRWLVSSGNKTWSEVGVDSRYWGNFSNSQGDADINEHGNPQVAGYSKYWKAGNIYDLAGNYYDWTLEAHNTSTRVSRCGNNKDNGNSYPASYRGHILPTTDYGSSTFRPTLIIE